MHVIYLALHIQYQMYVFTLISNTTLTNIYHKNRVANSLKIVGLKSLSKSTLYAQYSSHCHSLPTMSAQLQRLFMQNKATLQKPKYLQMHCITYGQLTALY